MRRMLALLVVACGSPSRPVPAQPPARPPPPPLPGEVTGSRIAATSRGALVLDADSGMLIATDTAGTRVADLAIGRGAGLFAYDPAREIAFAADRMGDRVVVVDTRDALRQVGSWPTPVEPFGVALTPDRKTLLVTTIADRTLVALDAQSGAERWRAGLSPEPRAISVSPDGTRALVSSLAVGALDHVDVASHAVTRLAFDDACEHCPFGDVFLRGGGSVRFLDARRAIATFQRSIPAALGAFNQRVYGGGSQPPITQHLAFLTFDGTTRNQAVAQVVENQPRFVWDRAHDLLYVAGFGSDTLLELPGLSRDSADGVEAKASSFVLRASERCGPDGLAVTDAGALLVWCSFSRAVMRLADNDLREGPPLVTSSLTPEQHAGLVLFHTTDPHINRDRALACSSCHLEGRTDGLSWKIGPQPLQTPLLAGRVTGTPPYKWDGSAKTLAHSLATTVTRLGGSGLDEQRSVALVAYLQSLPRPRSPTRDAAAVARGQAVFERAGCDDCHRAPTYSDGSQHQFQSTLARADTPSLVGIAASAPYYHDGSAPTLADLLAGSGSVHGMVELANLTLDDRRDLIVFLESL